MKDLKQIEIPSEFGFLASNVKDFISNLFEIIKTQSEEIAYLKEENILLKEKIKDLENKLSLNSKNSSKPPSSDGFKKNTNNSRKVSNKKPGGQLGHKGSNLKMLEVPDNVIIHSLENCFNCGNSVIETNLLDIKRRQVFDLPKKLIIVDEHQTEIKKCENCGCINESKFPEGVNNPVQYGNRLKSSVSYFSNYQLLPYDRLSEIFSDIFGHGLSVGTLYNSNMELYEKLENSELSIKEQILNAKVVNYDETGLYINKLRYWLHVSCTDKLTYYAFHKSRGKVATDEIGILPKYTGRAIHDHWGTYFTYSCTHGLCNAHHLRELTSVYEQENASWSKEMIELLVEIKEEVDKSKSNFELGLDTLKLLDFEKKYTEILIQGQNFYPVVEKQVKKKGKGKQVKGKNLLDRFRDYREEVLIFMYDFAKELVDMCNVVID